MPKKHQPSQSTFFFFSAEMLTGRVTFVNETPDSWKSFYLLLLYQHCRWLYGAPPAKALVLLNKASSIVFLCSSLSHRKSEHEQICEEWIWVHRALCHLLGLLMFLWELPSLALELVHNDLKALKLIWLPYMICPPWNNFCEVREMIDS